MQTLNFFNLLILLIFVIIWLGIILYLRIKKKKEISFLILVTIFFFYFYKVLDYTLLQYQTLIFLKLFMPNLILKGQSSGHYLNLIPIVALSQKDFVTSILNIVLFIPFGFFLPLIMKMNLKQIIFFGLIFSISIELVQFFSGQISGITFRIADINDVIFNTFGAVIGYSLYSLSSRLYYKNKER